MHDQPYMRINLLPRIRPKPMWMFEIGLQAYFTPFFSGTK